MNDCCKGTGKKIARSVDDVGCRWTHSALLISEQSNRDKKKRKRKKRESVTFFFSGQLVDL